MMQLSDKIDFSELSNNWRYVSCPRQDLLNEVITEVWINPNGESVTLYRRYGNHNQPRYRKINAAD
jgi:hypothetical protein